MTASLMRRQLTTCARARLSPSYPSTLFTRTPLLDLKQCQRAILIFRPRGPAIPKASFTSTTVRSTQDGQSDHRPNDERTLQLGNTVRILHERLPTLLASPLPQNILSPHITLHLFPSTHPHLPSVSGKLAYTAALWTAPVAWGRVPVLGNVKLDVLSERMVKNGAKSMAAGGSAGDEKLIVRWKTCGKTEHGDISEAMEKIRKIISRRDDSDDEFAGLFIFEFDEHGRILSHTIEHAEEGGSWDKMSKVISVTDWLLGRKWARKDEGVAGLALAKSGENVKIKGAQREGGD
ncbi:uncharacterized protein EI97DRAFT_411535 [Westerdykella ornata]|uniref:Uncharacterized protein n=1 Tax=Westerdykella ornata TaxID=318751 RepID=A0A6A6JVS9_WESOR|nr:uncharacterized protein EI97DRAFT_411535 [Westerdykella ornata]KAF2280335.1 hypothetical protein EI97DRAFT_411535 [Westerdykella ornata]